VVLLTAVAVVRERKAPSQSTTASKGTNNGSRYGLQPRQHIRRARFACRRAGSCLACKTLRADGAHAPSAEGVCPAATHCCVHVLRAFGLPQGDAWHFMHEARGKQEMRRLRRASASSGEMAALFKLFACRLQERDQLHRLWWRALTVRWRLAGNWARRRASLSIRTAYQEPFTRDCEHVCRRLRAAIAKL
jgi:hypothetical protein